jgi:hypothetical protein
LGADSPAMHVELRAYCAADTQAPVPHVQGVGSTLAAHPITDSGLRVALAPGLLATSQVRSFS